MNQWQQQYPGYPYPPPRPASRGTAVTAIALGFIIAFFEALGCLGYFALSSKAFEGGDGGWIPEYMLVNGVLRVLAAAALIVGATMLIRRNGAGCWVSAGAALSLVLFQIVEYAVWSRILPSSGSSPVSALVSVVLPVILIVLVFIGSTRRWLDEGRLHR